MQECMWCSRQFKPRQQGKNFYCLVSAGQWICWSCSDLYEAAELRMHMGALKARVDRLMSKVTTESGFELGLTIEWRQPRTRWGKPRGLAKDRYGRLWSVCQDDDYAKLRPLGRKMVIS